MFLGRLVTEPLVGSVVEGLSTVEGSLHFVLLSLLVPFALRYFF